MNRDLEIVKHILREGEDEAVAILEDAKLRAKKVMDDSKLRAKEFSDSKVLACRKKIKQDFSHQKELFEIERGQIHLSAKSEIISEIFRRAEQKLEDISLQRKKSFIESVLSRFAEIGDEVVLSPMDGSEIFEIKNFKVFYDKNLKLAVGEESLSSGVVLRNQKVNKIFTFSSLLRDERERILGEIAKRLFD